MPLAVKKITLNRHYNILVSGKVHGVFYRASTKQMADLLGLKGFVRNEPEGTVYIEVEGPEEVLVKFIQWCHHGPDKAVVSYVSVNEAELADFEIFEARR